MTADGTPCQCEHADHFADDFVSGPAGGVYVMKQRPAHPYLGVPAGRRRADFVGPVCDECGNGPLAKAVTGTCQNPDRVAREDLDLSQLRRHFRAMHGMRRGQKEPLRLLDLMAEHARQHHRYGPRHIHEGPYTLVRTRDGRVPVAVIPRPLGWFTGQGAVTSEEQRLRFLARMRETRQ